MSNYSKENPGCVEPYDHATPNQKGKKSKFPMGKLDSVVRGKANQYSEDVSRKTPRGAYK